MGLTYEEGMLQDEEALRTCLNKVSFELKVSQHSNHELQTDNDKSLSKIQELMAKIEDLELIKTSLRNELRDLKMRELQLSSDFADLEEENVFLQKQIMQLKQTQVDFESIKYENKQLTETVEELNHEVEAIDKLKAIFEKNLSEAFDMLQKEREEKCHLKKELDQRISSDSVNALQALASLGLNSFKSTEANNQFDEDMYQEEDENPALKKIETDIATSQVTELSRKENTKENALMGDLFSEIHVTEVRKLEHGIEKLEKEKENLEKSLEQSNQNIANLKNETSEKVSQLETSLESLNKSYTGFSETSEDLQSLTNDYSSYESAINQIHCLKQELNKTLSISNKDLLQPDMDIMVRRLETEVEDKSDMVKELSSVLQSTCDILKHLSKDLSHLYCSMCSIRSEVPSKKLLEFERSRINLSLENEQPVQDSPYIACRKLCDFVATQVGNMNQVMERIVEAEREKQLNDPQIECMVELKGKNSDLKSMLLTKKDQIATLRSVLKSNKNTAETALGGLKQRFESERQQMIFELQRNRVELQSLKEEKATFTSLRASFAQRCDEYLTQLDELQLTVIKAEEEKKTLNSLLRMAMQQKMDLSSKVEELKQRSLGRGMPPPGNFRPQHPPFPNNFFYPQQPISPLDEHRFIPKTPPRFHQRRDY